MKNNTKINVFTLPNFFTFLNMICGFVAMLSLLILKNNIHAIASVVIIIGTICDAADGYLARLRHEVTEFGKQLDALADMVSFGIAPAFVFVHRYLEYLGPVLIGIAILYIMCGAIRLARFNIIDTADGNILGLPITIAALIISIKCILDCLRTSVSIYENYIILVLVSVLMLGTFKLRKLGYKKD